MTENKRLNLNRYRNTMVTKLYNLRRFVECIDGMDVCTCIEVDSYVIIVVTAEKGMIHQHEIQDGNLFKLLNTISKEEYY